MRAAFTSIERWFNALCGWFLTNGMKSRTWCAALLLTTLLSCDDQRTHMCGMVVDKVVEPGCGGDHLLIIQPEAGGGRVALSVRRRLFLDYTPDSTMRFCGNVYTCGCGQ